jgi:hypothetical protein
MNRIPILLILALLFLSLSPPTAGVAAGYSAAPVAEIADLGTRITDPGYKTGLGVTLQGGGWGDDPAQMQEAVEAPQDTLAYGPDTVFWRTGTLLHAENPDYPSLLKRNPTAVARYQSNVGPDYTFFVLGATSRPLRVADAKVYILSRTGSYSGDPAIEIFTASIAGVGSHRVSMSSLSLLDTPTGSWRTISLSADPDDRLLAAGQSLLIYFGLGGVSGSNLDVRAIFEVTLTTHTTEIYLPMIRYTTLNLE